MLLRCPVCGRELEVKCSDSPEPFTAYDPMVGLEAYGAYSAEKEVLHEFEHEGFRVLHLLFGTGDEHLVMLPRKGEDGSIVIHNICREQLEEVEKAREEYYEFCEKCCWDLGCELARAGGSELCPGCDCETILEDLCEEEWDEWGEDEDDEWWDYEDDEWW